MNQNASLSRRNFITAASAAAACAGLAGAAQAHAAEEASYTYADCVQWAAEYDVVVLGIGFAGMVSAITAADNGARVLICEKAPDGEAGGNSRVCTQFFACSSGDFDNALTYYKALTGGRKVPDAVIEAMVHGVAEIQDQLAGYGLNKDEFVQQRDAEYPEFPGAEVVKCWSAHDGKDDSYIYQHIRQLIATSYADKIDVWFATPGTALIQDPMSKTVIGVTVDRNGEERNVRAKNGVVMCCGGFENNRDMAQTYLGITDYAVCGSLYNTGDGIRMALDCGARLWHAAVYEGHTGRHLNCGYYVSEEEHATSLKTVPYVGSIICVGTNGKRFGNESYKTRHGHVTDGNGLWENIHYPEKLFAIWDQAQMDEVEANGGLNPAYADQLVTCASVAEVAETIGCSEEDIQATLDDFNSFAANGRDYAFDRAAEDMRAFDGTAYYVLRVKGELLNTQGGPEHNERAEILDEKGEVIPNLYGAGEMGAFNAYMYQAGSNVAECFIYGKIAGASAAEAKGDLPAYAAAQPVESTPAQPGEETDLVAYTEPAAGTAEDGSLTASATGIGGDVPVSVKLDADGKIESVTVGDNNETEGIGSKAIEELPAKFVGLSGADEIDAVDGVSGATVTSNALKQAVKTAMGL